jgi:hypothetical protein
MKGQKVIRPIIEIRFALDYLPPKLPAGLLRTDFRVKMITTARGILIALGRMGLNGNFLAAACLLLTACAKPMSMRDIQGVEASCANVDRQIAVLERERAQNDKRLIAGVQSVAPALAVLSLVRGVYGRNVAIATGAWGKAIDAKLAELRRKRTTCRKR